MSDLINELNSKMSGNKESKKPVTTEPQADRGSDLVTAATGTGSKVSDQTVNKVEPSDSKTESTDSSWNLESALKEVKKLREENKHVRLKYEDTVTNLKKELDERVTTIESKYQPLTEAARELEELKKKEEDKKRDVAEKLAHREALLAETKARNEALVKEYEAKINAMNAKLTQHEAEQQAQAEIYKSKLAEELATIPAKFKAVAELLVKGAGEPRDALIALSEAKLMGTFEDKTVVVNHSVPGARDGARTTNSAMEEKQRAELDKLTGTQKIGTALKQMYQGKENAMFKTHNFNK